MEVLSQEMPAPGTCDHDGIHCYLSFQYKSIFVTDGYSWMLVITEVIARREGTAYIMTMTAYSALI